MYVRIYFRHKTHRTAHLKEKHTQEEKERRYTVSQKRPTTLFVYNFAKCWPILNVLSLLDSARNLQ